MSFYWYFSVGIKLGTPPSYAFDVPHRLTLAEDKGLILVADRENGRIQCFYSSNGTYHSKLQAPEFGGRLFSVAYSPINGNLLLILKNLTFILRLLLILKNLNFILFFLFSISY